MSRLLASFTLAAALIAGTAHAQETGSMRSSTTSIDVPEGSATGDAARAVYDKFALCIVKRHYMQVSKALAGPPNFDKDMQTLPPLMDKECFFGSASVGRSVGQSLQLTTNPISFRGQLFKAMVLRDFARKPAAFGPTALTMTGDNSDLFQFANCVIRRDPAASMTLFKANAGTAAEATAFGAIKPYLDECGAGRRVSIDKGTLIGFMAEAYYREASASSASSN
ncbi:MAG: hypothetical protein KF730_08880 [Sphingomonas sp.]|uniref:hypothetical protein n=1 Tax=Sphingomonas sp. TaxID=28214 RepID=UPI0025E8C0E0|nr:hypothetical protein [Sphingomonas sp.]MBX3564675.1 hypothetical protein [Sphingomonas sp.]